ncbi:hypothetical protein FI667_g12007, partial [Globisporangium splendens]
MLKPRLKLEGVHSSHRRLPLSACVEKRIRSPPLSPVSAATTPIGRGKERLKELRELTCQRSFLYHTRWHHVRNFYAITCEVMAAASVKRNMASLSISSSVLAPASPASPPIQPAWLGDFIRECRRAFPNPDVTLTQLEIALQNALRIDAQSSRFAEVTTRLKSVFQAFQRTDCALRVDIRELLCALFVLDRWQLATRKMLLLWFDQFSTVINSNNSGSSGQQAILKSELRQMLITACEGATDEIRLLPFLQELLHLNDGGLYITERAFLAYMDTRAAFLETIHLQCWTRLTDDTRLAFYRDLALQAMQHFENEQLKVRMQAAVNFWRLLEPRSRMNRFVANAKLCKRGDAHFRACSSQKLVRTLQNQRLRRQQMREWVAIARVQHRWTLSHWSFRVWSVFTLSMCQLRVEDEKALKAARQKTLATFIAKRHRNSAFFYLLACHFHEVAGAQIREQALHRDLYEQARSTAESTQMALEDARSGAIQVQARELAERARQRAFQDVTQRVYAQRKLKQQEDARTQCKQERRAQVLAQVDFATLEGKAAYQAEGARIFGLDPVVMQKSMLQNSDDREFVLPKGCRWKLQLEDYGGRFAKPFYLNTETFEKLVCDEVVLDNCVEIAEQVLTQQQNDTALSGLNTKATAVARDKLEHDAALAIQGLFRCRYALLVTRSVIRAMFVKRIDPSSGDQVYFNTRRVETRRKPPKLIGSDEPLIPVESTTWVR